ncbi:CMRF35-like molecule 1 [Colossoma macropomum]|uniref:CMRF35-like molecule 1 n=1 Tax=Colossoma macropomum TaxID=42526 RepID=UPI00186517EA|nr:CMRF35-like molecule 1 [Colossoma macropomum]
MSFSISFTLLAVVSGMLHDEITETGTEGNVAVITCPYSTGYESYTKYFCKGGYSDCVTLIKSNGKEPWTYKGRIIMNDNTEQKKLVVTISDLRMEDAGNYGCGIESTGRDPFTLVHLKVIKAPKPPKTTQPKLTQSPPPPATKNNQSNAPTLSTNKTENSTSAVTNGTGSTTEDRGNTTQPATHHPDSDAFISIGGVFGGVLLALAIISGIFFALRCSAEKETAATTLPNSEVNMEEVRLYEEIQTTDAAQANGSVSTCQGTVLHSGNTSASDRCSNLHPACITVYSAITNQGLNSHSDDTCPAQHTHYAVTPIKGLHSETPQSSKEPNYCKVYFANDKTMDESPTYSLITVPQN